MSESASVQESRARIASVIDNASEPLPVEAIAERTGLHVNTVRGHLDVLLAGETIEREAAGPNGRGRPRWLYRAAAPSPSPYQALAEALSAQLTQVGDPALAGRAAERWAGVLPDLPPVSSPDEAVAEATTALNQLGFTAVSSPLGDSIAVTACPYADLVAENPLICTIHAELVVQLLRQTGQPVTLEALDVWARPGMCQARLSRPDLGPAWTIVPGADDPTEGADA